MITRNFLLHFPCNMLCLLSFHTGVIGDFRPWLDFEFIGYYCQNTTYNPKTFPGSLYRTNVNFVLDTLSSKASHTGVNGFYNFTAGDDPSNRVYGLFLCRGDVSDGYCKNCIVSARSELDKHCTNQKVAIFWYEECMLRFSNQTIFSRVDSSVYKTLYNPYLVTEPHRHKFVTLLRKLLHDGADEAANNTRGAKKFAIQYVDASTWFTLYTLAQCTPDLSGDDCKSCLTNAIATLPLSLSGDIRIGGRVVSPSCSVRYEGQYCFYTSCVWYQYDYDQIGPPSSNIGTNIGPPSSNIGTNIGPPSSNKGSGLSGGAISGIPLAVLGVLFFAACLYLVFYRKRNVHKISPKDQFNRAASDTAAKAPESIDVAKRASPSLAGVVVERSFEFWYEELAIATKDFSLANKIGEGGFGSVYYAELRGEKAAIKKMDLKAKREFVAELRVLTHVHHQNLVRLIGYCVKGSLFLVYEYIDNGNLSQNLRGSGCDTLSWSSRVQIAVDSARGLEYIHEHTTPAYIHRDIKSANILIDKDFRAKVADFGLAKLAEVKGLSLQSRLVGTFGYMAPEYANCGTVSPKVDVYAFGVMLYELISAKAAVVDGGSTTDTKGLVGLFEQVPILPDSNDDLRKLVDPRLGDNYPIESVSKMFQLAKLCTHKKPESRPSMRSVIVALMALSSPTKDSKIFVPHLETEILKYEYSMIKSMETEVLGSETFTVTSVESEAYTIEEGIED